MHGGTTGYHILKKKKNRSLIDLNLSLQLGLGPRPRLCCTDGLGCRWHRAREWIDRRADAWCSLWQVYGKFMGDLMWFDGDEWWLMVIEWLEVINGD